MSLETLRNVKTGETQDVETNSDEYVELINELYDHDGSARPAWEITGRHHRQRLDAGEEGEADFGYEDKPVPAVVSGLQSVGPEIHPERALTQAEVDAGVESHEQKMEAIKAGHSTINAPLGVDRDVQPLERTAPQDRITSGSEKVGSSSSKSSRRSSNRARASSGTSSGGGSTSSGTSGSGSSGSASGSSGSGSGSGSSSSGS